MHVRVERSPDTVDLTTFADAYARVVKRIVTTDPEALQHAG